MNCQSEEVLEEFEDVLSSIDFIDEHLSVVLLISSDEFVNAHNSQAATRIQILSRIDRAFDIKPFNVASETTGALEMSDETFSLFKCLFSTAKQTPSTWQ